MVLAKSLSNITDDLKEKEKDDYTYKRKTVENICGVDDVKRKSMCNIGC